MPHHAVPPAKRSFARKLRGDMTEAEAKLWEELRDERKQWRIYALDILDTEKTQSGWMCGMQYTEETIVVCAIEVFVNS